MLNSKFEYLRSPNSITLAAGHGGSDPGAVSGSDVEAQDNIFTTNRIYNNLKAMGLEVNLVPHDLDLIGAISYVNSRYQWGQTWALEIHRDSASGLSSNTADNRVGVYGFGQYTGQDGKFYTEDVRSMSIAKFMRDKMVQLGAETSSWARADNSASFGRLGWIRDTKPVAHLIELAFVQGDNSPTHLNWLADIASAAIYEAFTGSIAPSLNIQINNAATTNANKSLDDYSIDVLRRYYDLPLNIPSLENLWKDQQHPDQALGQILESFRKNINDAKLQKDQLIAQQSLEIVNLQNNTGSNTQFVQLKNDLAIANQQKENYRQQLANLLTNYDQLQADFANYKNGSNSVTPNTNNQNGATITPLSASKVNFSSVTSNSGSMGTNTSTVALTNLGNAVDPNNSSLKPFWKSKKFGANLINTVASLGLILWQTAQILPNDSIQAIVTKLGAALAGVASISFVSNQYIKAQGKVDETSFGQLAGEVLKQVVNLGK